VIRLFFIVCVFILVSGCTEIEVPDNAVTLDVNFEWTKESGCSNVSPPISVTNIPKNTKYLKVSMKDLDFMNMDHGGCEVPYTGTNTISEGALSTYLGPCPERIHSYEITVQALSADKKLILGHGKAVRKYPAGN
jgi:phosphatidylethanolamine-binding protein (PEBP) family uncharacterized protein